jgi:hypothetical protein
MTPRTKNIVIWSSIIGGSALIGVIIYSVTIGKQRKEELLKQQDAEMAELMKRIDKAPK